jgi:hypothetical protein
MGISALTLDHVDARSLAVLLRVGHPAAGADRICGSQEGTSRRVDRARRPLSHSSTGLSSLPCGVCLM